jgi:hypothetical protein
VLVPVQVPVYVAVSVEVWVGSGSGASGRSRWGGGRGRRLSLPRWPAPGCGGGGVSGNLYLRCFPVMAGITSFCFHSNSFFYFIKLKFAYPVEVLFMSNQPCLKFSFYLNIFPFIFLAYYVIEP